MFDSLALRVVECDAKIEALLMQLGRHDVTLDRPVRTRPSLIRVWCSRVGAGVDLTRINGLSVATVMTVLSEVGPDLIRFASVKHLCSWLGLCTGTKISGAKCAAPAHCVRRTGCSTHSKITARSLLYNHSVIDASYRGLCARTDRPAAHIVVAHKLARMVYFMLTRGEVFVEQEQQRYGELRQQRSVTALKRAPRHSDFVLSRKTW